MVARLHDDDGHISFLIQFAPSFLHAQRDDSRSRISSSNRTGWSDAMISSNFSGKSTNWSLPTGGVAKSARSTACPRNDGEILMEYQPIQATSRDASGYE
jgi:hypothetical protein